MTAGATSSDVWESCLSLVRMIRCAAVSHFQSSLRLVGNFHRATCVTLRSVITSHLAWPSSINAAPAAQVTQLDDGAKSQCDASFRLDRGPAAVLLSSDG